MSMSKMSDSGRYVLQINPMSDLPAYKAKGCQYITGKPSGDDSCKCNAPVIEGTSYCPEHTELCFRTATPAEQKILKG